jgi:hypothetical protein
MSSGDAFDVVQAAAWRLKLETVQSNLPGILRRHGLHQSALHPHEMAGIYIRAASKRDTSKTPTHFGKQASTHQELADLGDHDDKEGCYERGHLLEEVERVV